MSFAEITSALWRRRPLFAVTLIACLSVVAVITAAVPKVYKATATIFVGRDTPRLDTDQGEQLTRTYTTLAGNPNVAQEALEALDIGVTRQELLDKMSFTPVERTQLLEIGAEDRSPAEAQLIANTYAYVFAKTVKAQVAAGDAPARVSVNQPAVEPSDPIRPNLPLYLGFGGLLSLLIAAAVAVARDRLDRRLRIGPGEDTVQGQLILARIPTLLGPGEVNGDGAGSWVAGAARILRSDALRILRTNLDLATGRVARTIAITSPENGEGKTTIAAQLALTLATDREKVAIVECDLRNPALNESGFGSRWVRSAPGLSDYLDKQATVRQVVKAIPSMAGLHVVWAGSAVAEPGPLLRSGRLRQLLESLGRTHDWVILDTPSLAVGDDALIASSYADGTVMVIDAEETTGPALGAGFKHLRTVRARILGVVVNHAPPTGLDSYRYLTEEPTSLQLAQPLQEQ
jgi:capsular exopolysaccharide synthesis family protein